MAQSTSLPLLHNKKIYRNSSPEPNENEKISSLKAIQEEDKLYPKASD